VLFTSPSVYFIGGDACESEVLLKPNFFLILLLWCPSGSEGGNFKAIYSKVHMNTEKTILRFVRPVSRAVWAARR